MTDSNVQCNHELTTSDKDNVLYECVKCGIELSHQSLSKVAMPRWTPTMQSTFSMDSLQFVDESRVRYQAIDVRTGVESHLETVAKKSHDYDVIMTELQQHGIWVMSAIGGWRVQSLMKGSKGSVRDFRHLHEALHFAFRIFKGEASFADE